MGAERPIIVSHEPEETYYVISSEGHMEIGDCKAVLNPGSAVYMPPNTKDTARCTGTEPPVFVFCFARDSFAQVVYHFDA